MRCAHADLWVQHNVEISICQLANVCHRGFQRRNHVDVDTQFVEQLRDFFHVVTVPKAQSAWTQNVAARTALGSLLLWLQNQMAAQLIKRFAGTPILFALVRRQLQRNDGNVQFQGVCQTAWIVLNQLGGARRTYQHGRRFEAFNGLTCRIFEKLCRVATQVTCLECCVRDWRATGQALNHGEQQIGVGIALGCVQHIVHIAHGGGNAHGANVWRSFVCPKRELHLVFLCRQLFATS